MCTYEGQDQQVARVATNYTRDVCTSMMCTRTVCTEGSIPVPGNWYKVCMQPIQLYIHCHTVHVHIQYMNVHMYGTVSAPNSALLLNRYFCSKTRILNG